MNAATCAVEGCEKRPTARGWCNPHYQRWRRYDDPTFVPACRVPWLDQPTAEGHTFHPADERHGTVHGYGNLNCRCRACCEANTEAHREYMHSHPEQQERHRRYQRQYEARRRSEAVS